MENLPIKQLIKTALITAPLMAIIYATPLYIFKPIPFANGLIIFPIVTFPILFSWLLNILVLFWVKQRWSQTLLRTLIICLIMFAISGLAVHFIHPFVNISDASILLVRVVNIISVNVIIYVLIDSILIRENKNKIELENANLKLVKLEAEFKLLKDQINPHFLFNALSTAKSLIKPKPELAEAFLIRLSEFLRLSMNNTKKTVPLSEELILCEDFIALNRIRFGNSIELKQDLKINLHENFIPYFSLLTLAENAIKHTLFFEDAPLSISITADEDSLEIKNNKNPKFTLEASTKTGLKNLNDRYKLLSGKEIEVIENDSFFIVKIPLLKK